MRAPTPPLFSTPSRPAQLAEWFARVIRTGRFMSGEKLPTEQELNAQFGVSRTVIREAMASLRSEGLVVSRQGSGVFVADHRANRTFRIVRAEVRSLTEIENVLQLRLAVELEAAAIAAKKRSDEDLAHMRRWLDAIDASIAAGDSGDQVQILLFTARFRRPRAIPISNNTCIFWDRVIIPPRSIRPLSETPEQRRPYLEHIQAEHRRIYQAIERRNAETARFALREHLEGSREHHRRTLYREPATG